MAGAAAPGVPPQGGRCFPLSPARPLRPQEQPDLRRSSIVLFGNLTKFSEGNCEVFFEQILNGLVTLLLHLQDPKPEVVKVSAPLPELAGRSWGAPPPRRGDPARRRPLKRALQPPLSVPQACKFALRMCGPSMGCEGLCDMFLNHLREDRSLHYGEFMNNVCKHLVSGCGTGAGAARGARCPPPGAAGP